jgi:hypothetical protein
VHIGDALRQQSSSGSLRSTEVELSQDSFSRHLRCTDAVLTATDRGCGYRSRRGPLTSMET